MAELRKQGIVSKARTLKSGKTSGGIKAKLDRQVQTQTSRQSRSEALLMGRIFDDAGNRMTPTHARKRGVKYRYYLSSALLNGEAERTGSVSRVPAAALEAVVIRSVRQHLKSPAAMNDRSLIETHIARVEVHPERLIVRFAQGERAANDPAGPEDTLSVTWQKTAATRRREILLPEGVSPQNARRIRSENRTTLLASIARGRRWLEELVIEPTATAETIAKREGCTARKVNMAISLAFLAPDLVKAAIDGTLPQGMGVVRLADLPAEWSQQHRMLGLPWS
jgi:site-specific DNA recombinase